MSGSDVDVACVALMLSVMVCTVLYIAADTLDKLVSLTARVLLVIHFLFSFPDGFPVKVIIPILFTVIPEVKDYVIIYNSRSASVDPRLDE